MESSVPLFWDTIQSSLEEGRVPPPAVRQLLVGLNRLGEESNMLGGEEWQASNNHGPG